MPKIRFVHWNAEEAEERAAKLRALGYQVVYEETRAPSFIREVRELRPAAVVIDLGRVPSQGLSLGLTLREQKTTRQIPLVFVGGEPEKVDRVKKLLPDATFAGWTGIERALKRALSKPPVEAVRRRRFDAYSGVALVAKLGVREGTEIRLIRAPKDFDQALTGLPPSAAVRRGTGKRGAVNLWFVTKSSDVESGISKMIDCAEGGGLWIVWPKKASGVKSDVTQLVVRKVGLAAGLVDYKIASLTDVWSGLRFTRRG